MKNIAFLILLSGICMISKSQNANKDLLGKWYSIDGKNTARAFTPTIERIYLIKKNVKVVPIYNIEQARITVTGNLLNEKEAGGGGIDVTYKFEISNDTLRIYDRDNTIKYSFKKISEAKFQLLTGRKF